MPGINWTMVVSGIIASVAAFFLVQALTKQKVKSDGTVKTSFIGFEGEDEAAE